MLSIPYGETRRLPFDASARVPLVIGGKGYGAYYVYSNPVVLTIE